MRHSKILWLLSLVCLIACTNKGIDFTYSPAQPKAGESVIFSNQTEKGDSWLWTFSDDTYATLRSPSKIFKKAGTYTVTLMVDSVRWKTVTKEITIYDTIPSFSISSDSILYMQEVTLKALVYNPYNKDLTYSWQLPSSAHITEGTTTDATLTLYFDQRNTAENISLEVTLGGEKTVAEQQVQIYDNQADAIICRAADDALYRQRLFDIGLSDAYLLNAWDGAFNTNEYQYNGQRIALRGSKIVIEELSNDGSVSSSRDIYAGSAAVTELTVDAVAQKIYAIENDELLIMNINGKQVSRWSDMPCTHLCIALERGSLFLANADGVYELPLVGNPQNIVTTEPVLRSNIKSAKALSYDSQTL